MRAMQIAEDTGELDTVLSQLATEHQEDGLRRLAILSEWVPRSIYLLVAAYVGWQVISSYRNYLNAIMSQLDSL